jgi:hypothetical protein
MPYYGGQVAPSPPLATSAKDTEITKVGTIEDFLLNSLLTLCPLCLCGEKIFT